MNVSTKITASHLSRKAVLYIRQSSMRQVQFNVESTRRQYALKDALIRKGWGPDFIEVIDEDLGISGKFSEDRSGFQKLIGDIANGIVGVVACIEASRLSRNSTDWARIIDFCAMTDTLIMDEDMAYDPLDPNDRLLLGVKGSITEMELYTIRQRLWGGKVNKIQRGEYHFQLPVGYVYDPLGKIVFDPSLDVQAAVRKLFHTFTTTGSICQTVKYFSRHGLTFPCNKTSGASKGQTEWQALTVNRARFILKHPFYCGRYVFGRSHLHVMPGRNNYVTLDEGDWLANIPGHHPAYISEEEFQNNQKRIAKNRSRPYDDAPTAARNGAALLQGIAYCGCCGRRMTVKYETAGKQSAKSAYPVYVCEGDRNAPERRQCTRINGSAIDDRISALLMDRLNDEAVKEAIAIRMELRSRWEGTEKMLLLRLQQAEYESGLMKKRYLACDPENALVRIELEKAYNDTLRKCAEARMSLEEERIRHNSEDPAEIQERFSSLVSDFKKIWSNGQTDIRTKKKLIQLLIQNVTLTREKGAPDCLVQVLYSGGGTEIFTAPCIFKGSTPAYAAVKEYLYENSIRFTPDELAGQLNELKLLRNNGKEWTSGNLSAFMRSAGIKTRKQYYLEQGYMTVENFAKKTGLTRQSILWRIKQNCYDGKYVMGTRCGILISPAALVQHQ